MLSKFWEDDAKDTQENKSLHLSYLTSKPTTICDMHKRMGSAFRSLKKKGKNAISIETQDYCVHNF